MGKGICFSFRLTPPLHATHTLFPSMLGFGPFNQTRALGIYRHFQAKRGQETGRTILPPSASALSQLIAYADVDPYGLT